MSESVHVDFPCACDAAGFVELLAERGLTAVLTTESDYCTLEVGYAVDPALRLRSEVEAALAAWLEHGEHALVPDVGREHEFVLRPPGD